MRYGVFGDMKPRGMSLRGRGDRQLLLKEQHLAEFVLVSDAQAGKIGAARNAPTLVIGPVPDHPVASISLMIQLKRTYELAGNIVDLEGHLSRLQEHERNGCAGVEGIRVVRLQVCGQGKTDHIPRHGEDLGLRFEAKLVAENKEVAKVDFAVAAQVVPRIPAGVGTGKTEVIGEEEEVQGVHHEIGIACPILDRYKLGADCCISGPAIVEEIDSTTLLKPAYTAHIDRFGNLLIEL